jgi:hypothetical protein
VLSSPKQGSPFRPVELLRSKVSVCNPSGLNLVAGKELPGWWESWVCMHGCMGCLTGLDWTEPNRTELPCRARAFHVVAPSLDLPDCPIA